MSKKSARLLKRRADEYTQQNMTDNIFGNETTNDTPIPRVDPAGVDYLSGESRETPLEVIPHKRITKRQKKTKKHTQQLVDDPEMHVEDYDIPLDINEYQENEIRGDLNIGELASNASQSRFLIQCITSSVHYQPTFTPTNDSESYLHTNILLKTEVQINDFILIPCQIHVASFTAHTMDKLPFIIYRIDNISAGNLTLVYVSYSGVLMENWIPVNFLSLPLQVIKMFMVAGAGLSYHLNTRYGPFDSFHQVDAPSEKIPLMKGLKTVEDFKNGKILNINDRTNSTGRMECSNLVRRMTESNTLSIVTKNIIDFDSIEAWSTLTNMGAVWENQNSRATVDTSGLLAHTKKWSSIRWIPASKNHEIYSKLMSNNTWKVNAPGLSLQSFISDRILDSKEDRQHTKLAIALALLNFENFLIFTLGLCYNDVTLSLRQSITEGLFYDRMWNSDYVCYEVNSALCDIFYVLNNMSRESFLAKNPDIDISCSDGTQSYIRNQLRKIVPTLLGQVKYDSLRTIVPYTLNVSPTTNAPPKSKQLKLTRVCIHDLRYKLKCVDSANKPCMPCSSRTKCTWKHLDLRYVTKVDLNQFVYNRRLPSDQQNETLKCISSNTLIGTKA
jgi:hypothetical protein